MIQHKVPPDTRDKEKLFGGVLTVTQFIAFITFICLGAALGLLFNTVINSIWVIAFFVILGAIAGAPFAFYKNRKMGDMELAKLLYLKYLFKKKTKKKIHINENYQRYGQGGE